MGSTSKRAGRRRHRAAFGAVLALTATCWTGAQVTGAPEAEAQATPPVAFTADELPTWQTNGVVWAAAEAGGTVFAGGTFSAIRPPGSPAGSDEQPVINFAAFDAATGEPTDCTLDFTIGSGTAKVAALDISPDGETLYAAGVFSAVDGVGVSHLAAIDIDTCTVDASFHPVVTGAVRSLDVTVDRIYLGGDFADVEGENRERFAALTRAGELLPWNPSADKPSHMEFPPQGLAVEALPQGRVAIGGDFFTVGGASSHALAVVDDTAGDLVRAYPGFIEDTSVVKDITSDATGFYTANEGTGGGAFDGRLAMELDTLDQRWRDTCLGATQALEIHGSVLYSGSHAHDCSSMGGFPDGRRRHLLAQTVDDPALLGWFPDTNDGISQEKIGPRTLVVAPSGGTDYLWVGGTFTTVNGQPQQGLTRFTTGPDTGRPWVPEANASSVAPGEIQLRWRASRDLDDSELTYRVYRNGDYSDPVYTVTESSSPWRRPQLTYTDTDVVAGQTYSYRVTADDGTNVSGLSATVRATPAATADPYAAQVVADEPALYWRYDDHHGAFAADASGTDNSGVHKGSPTRGVTPAAVPGGSEAVGYNGRSYQFSYSDRPSERQDAYTIETWFRTTTSDGGKLIGFENRYERPSSSYDKHIYMTNGGRLVFGVYTGTTRTASTWRSYNDGQWHHVVATLGPDGMRLYVDGEEEARGWATSSQSYTGYWRVGGGRLTGWPLRSSSDFFDGQIDETAVYHTALTESQIQRHYELGTS